MNLLVSLFLCCLPPLISVAFFTLLERKVLSIVGFRLGPNKVSVGGFLQPIMDAVKLSNKSSNTLSSSSLFFYYISSICMILMSLFLFSTISLFPSFFSFKFSVLFFFLILSFNSLNFIVSGWSAFSKFSLVGCIRSVCQLISYESLLFLCIFFLLFTYMTLDFSTFLSDYVSLLFLFLIIPFYCWIPSFLAELNRTPYDFSEGESELVSGFNTEFGSGCFTLIFLAEYTNIVFFCILTSFFFFTPFHFFIFFFFFLVVWIRSVLPRLRFDKLMSLSWKMLIPFLTLIFCIQVMYF